MRKKTNLVFAATAGLLAGVACGTTAQAQSSDALIDKLLEKGVLTVKEANELREEADKGFTSAYQVKTGLPDWVTSMKFGGDLRGRWESFTSDNPNYVDRTRFRYRLRAGTVVTMQDNLEVGMRLGSGDIDNAGSITLGKSGKKGAWDLSYRWKSLEGDAWYEEVTDSDFGAYYSRTVAGSLPGTTRSPGAGIGNGTNVRGHVIKANYSPYDSLTIGFTGLITELIDRPATTTSVPNNNSSEVRFMVDLVFKF